jgi:hypothetical protein
MSGLTVGFMSIDKLDLELKLCSGTPREKRAVSLLSFIVIGLNYFPYSKEASLLVSDIIVIECYSNGSSPNFSRSFSPLSLGSPYFSNCSPLFRRNNSPSYLHRSLAITYCRKSGTSNQGNDVNTIPNMLSDIKITRLLPG